MTDTAKLTALAEAAKAALPDAVLDTKLAAGRTDADRGARARCALC